MKLMRLGPVGAERPVVRLDDTTYVDVSDAVADYDEAFFGSGGLEALRALVAERTASGQVQSFGHERIGAPIAQTHQILCIGLNYSDHAAETGTDRSRTSRSCSPSPRTRSWARTTTCGSPAARRRPTGRSSSGS